MAQMNVSESPTEEILTQSPVVTPLISDSQLKTIFIYFVPITLIFGFGGIFTNAANICIFHKLGLSSTSNLNFFTLAIADLLFISYLIAAEVLIHPSVDGVVMNISVASLMAYFYPLNLAYSAFGSWVTTIISVERSCSIVFPLKVKSIFTRKTNAALFVGIALYQAACLVPGFLARRIKAFPFRLLFARFPSNRAAAPNSSALIYAAYITDTNLDGITSFASFSLPVFICFIIVVIATIFLVIKFNQSRKEREKMTGRTGQKDTRIVVTVIAVCVIYVVAFTPYFAVYVLILAYPPFDVYNPYFQNLVFVITKVGTFLQSVSSSINFFIYIKMNLKYRKQFLALFRREPNGINT